MGLVIRKTYKNSNHNCKCTFMNNHYQKKQHFNNNNYQLTVENIEFLKSLGYHVFNTKRIGNFRTT